MAETLSIAPFSQMDGLIVRLLPALPTPPYYKDAGIDLSDAGTRRKPILHDNNTSRARLLSRHSLLYRWIWVPPGKTWNRTDHKPNRGETTGPFSTPSHGSDG